MMNAETVSVAPFDVKDFRSAKHQKANPLHISNSKLLAALDAAGVSPDGLTLRLRIKDGDGCEQGLCERLAENTYRVTIKIAAKAEYAARHLYVVNNSLVHELRHVAQYQSDPKFSDKYLKANKNVGYHKNPYEVEARFYGRRADHTGTKNTGPAGAALGKTVWAITFNQ